jgi:hypothetical protein
MVTYFVAMPFVSTDGGGLAPGPAIECPSEAVAVRRAEAMARSEGNAGAISFSRRAIRASAKSMTIIKTFGEMLDEFCCG